MWQVYISIDADRLTAAVVLWLTGNSLLIKVSINFRHQPEICCLPLDVIIWYIISDDVCWDWQWTVGFTNFAAYGIVIFQIVWTVLDATLNTSLLTSRNFIAYTSMQLDSFTDYSINVSTWPFFDSGCIGTSSTKKSSTCGTQITRTL
jgi:hypothetical protein